MSHHIEIHVVYPLEAGRLFLRREPNWDADIQGDQIDAHTFSFKIDAEEPFFEFKPILRLEETVHWHQGLNYLAKPASQSTLTVYPHFFGPAHQGSFSESLSIFGPESHYHMLVYQPPGYAENHLRRYPVLYVQDGNGLLLPHEAYLGNTGLLEGPRTLLDGLSVIGQAIVVGVYATNMHADYQLPGYQVYGETMIEYILPTIANRYRTLSGPEHTTLMGASLGATTSFFLAWEWPDHFGKTACLSPGFWYGNDLFARVLSEPKRQIKIYLDSGWPQDNFASAKRMRDALLYRGYKEGVELLFQMAPHRSHQSNYWRNELHVPFSFLFG